MVHMQSSKEKLASTTKFYTLHHDLVQESLLTIFHFKYACEQNMSLQAVSTDQYCNCVTIAG